MPIGCFNRGEREILSWDCPSNMDPDTGLVEIKGPLMSPDHHYLPSSLLSPSWNFQQMSPPPLSPLWNFQQTSPPPLSPLWNFQQMSPPPSSPLPNFSVDNSLSSSNGPYRLHQCKYRSFPTGDDHHDDMELSGRAINYAKGQNFQSQTWAGLSGALQRMMRVGFNGLDNELKNMFLDIAYFLIEENIDKARWLHEGCGFFMDIGIRVLVNNGSIVIENGTIQMNDVLQHMAREIVLLECFDEPGKRSRLWDICHVLTKHTRWGETIPLEMVQPHFDQSLVDAARSLKVSRFTLKHPCRERKWGETIPLEMVQQHFGQSLVDAARSLEVSRSTLKRHCRKLGITSWPSKMMTSEGPVPIGEYVQIAGSSTNGELDSRMDCFQRHQGLENGRDALLEFGQHFVEECVAFKNERKVIHHAGQSCHNAVAFSERKGTGTGQSLKMTPRKRRETVTLEMLQPQLGQSLVDAASSLNVSKSTLKRRCRKLGIPAWPLAMMMGEGSVPIGESVQNAGSHITNASRLPSIPGVVSDQLNSEFHVERSGPACYQQQNFLSPSTALDPSTDQFTPGMPPVVTSKQDNLSSVMTTVKAAYEDINIKFQIDLTAGRITDQLKDGVAKRLQLQDSSYEMTYKDDDDDWILIKCDEDIHECIRNSNLPGSKAVKLYLRDKKMWKQQQQGGVKRSKHYL